MCLKTDQTLMIVFLFNSIFFNDAFQQVLHSGGPAGFDSFSVCQWTFEKKVFEKIDVLFFMDLDSDRTFMFVFFIVSSFTRCFF